MASVFDPLRWGAVALDVLASGRATPDALAARQQARLARLLEVALRRSPLYRERLKGMTPDAAPLSALPILSKAELMARFDDWVTDPQLKLAQICAFTADPQRIGQSYLNRYLIWQSSGTSHQPGWFVQDAPAMAVYDALEALRRSTPRPLQRSLDPLLLAERIAFVGATSGHFASMVSMQRLCQLNPFMKQNLQCISILQSTSSLVSALNAFAPTVIATYPTVAALLAELSVQGKLHFAPKEIWTGGETLSLAVRQRVQRTLGCSLRNSYGASEFLSIGWECGHGHLHANTDWLILEPVDRQGHAVPAGQASHSTLLTNLANHVQPLIRYDLGDQVTLQSERCECGSTLPVIEVQGRRDDPLLMAGKDGQPITLLPLALTSLLEEEAGVFDFQLQQLDHHRLLLRLDLHGAQAAPIVARCRNSLEKFVMLQGLAPIRLSVKLGQAITRGPSGKVQRIVALPTT